MGMFDYRPPAMKFTEGQRQGGRVVEVAEGHRRQYRKDGSGGLLYWQDHKPTENAEIDSRTGKPNDPVMQGEIVVETGIDNGKGETERTIYFGKQRLEKAFKDAARVVRLGRGEDITGWEVYVTQTGTEPGAGVEDAQTWAVELIRGTPGAPPVGASGVVDTEPREAPPVVKTTRATALAGVGREPARSTTVKAALGIDDSEPPF